MIYKTKTKYLRVEGRLEELALIEMRGNKITVNNHNFYVDKDFNITEEITGLQVPYTDYYLNKSLTLEDAEENIKSIIVSIENAINKRIKEGYTVQNILNKLKEKQNT